jgi:glycosyltransferase involved in cell wall biosynthesis
MPDARPLLSLVMPAYNEEENLPLAVERARAPLTAAAGDGWEIVVVDDGSTDGTAALADGLAARDPRVRVVHHAQNRGLGGALITGFGAARGAVIAYVDADLPFEMTALAEAYALMRREGADVVAGYRLTREGDGPRRRLYTAVYNGIVRATLGLRVRDVNCPLKLIRREVFEAEGLHSTGVFIDAELLARARRNGFRIVQFGVTYTPRAHGASTLSRPSVVAKTLVDLARFRLGLLGPSKAPARAAARTPAEAAPSVAADASP